MQDGQNLFDPARSFAGVSWQMHQTAERLILAGVIEPIIIVGVDHAGADRIDEFTLRTEQRLSQGGGAKRFGRMLVEEVQSFVGEKYRVLHGHDDTGIGGSSLGAHVSLILALLYPEVFGRLAVMSPSVWWAGRAILRDVQESQLLHPPRTWLDIGDREGSRPAQEVANTRDLRDAMIAKGWRPGRELAYLEAEGADHSEGAWARRVAPMLQFLFPAKTEIPPEKIW
jgi:predicted alpha/beta superfamily hydrolase